MPTFDLGVSAQDVIYRSRSPHITDRDLENLGDLSFEVSRHLVGSGEQITVRDLIPELVGFALDGLHELGGPCTCVVLALPDDGSLVWGHLAKIDSAVSSLRVPTHVRA